MKTVVVISSIFFLLGLKLSNIIDLRGKAEVVDTIITNKIIKSKPVKALPLFKDNETEAQAQAQKDDGSEKREVTEPTQHEKVN